MALWDLVKERYDLISLKQLTNVNSPGNSSISDTTGTRAANAAIAWFQRVVTGSFAFDYTDNAQIDIAVDATVHFLKKWAGKLSSNLGEEEQRIEKSMVAYSRSVAIRGRILMTTDSVLTPTPEDQAGLPVRPEFDNQRFDGLFPNQPPAP